MPITNVAITVKTPNAVWSEAFAGLPCSYDLAPVHVPQGRATFSGFTIPTGRRSIPLACSGTHFAEGMASGPTTWRLASQSTGTPDDVTTVTPTQNLNRLVVLIVSRPKPTARSSKR